MENTVNETKKTNKFLSSHAFKSISASLICIAVGLLVGLLIMIIVSFTKGDEVSVADAFEGLIYLIRGPFGSKFGFNMVTNLGNVIFYTVPLIFTGLSIVVAYKTGLFNIGAPGQFIMGTIGSLTVALSLSSDNPFVCVLIWLLAIMFGAFLAAIWGMITGALKAFFNINEVIVGIMTNWIAANICTWYFTSMTQFQNTAHGGCLSFVTKNATPTFGLDQLFKGSMADGGIVFAIIAAVFVFVLLEKTKLGYELKACGYNKHASKYAGLNEKKNIILSMAIAGALAGLGACFCYLNAGNEFKYDSAYMNLPQYGFSGIASSFLASCNPVGTIFSSFFIRWINMGGEYLTKVGFNRYIADIVIASIVYLAGFSRLVYELIERNKKKKLLKLAVEGGEITETTTSQEEVVAEIPLPKIEIEEVKEEPVPELGKKGKEEKVLSFKEQIEGPKPKKVVTRKPKVKKEEPKVEEKPIKPKKGKEEKVEPIKKVEEKKTTTNKVASKTEKKVVTEKSSTPSSKKTVKVDDKNDLRKGKETKVKSFAQVEEDKIKEEKKRIAKEKREAKKKLDSSKNKIAKKTTKKEVK